MLRMKMLKEFYSQECMTWEYYSILTEYFLLNIGYRVLCYNIACRKSFKSIYIYIERIPYWIERILFSGMYDCPGTNNREDFSFANRAQNFSGNQGQNFSGNQGQNFSGNQQGQNFSSIQGQNFSGNQVQNFSGNQVQNFSGNQGQNFSGNQGQNFSGNQQGQNFPGNQAQKFSGNQGQDFSGNFSSYNQGNHGNGNQSDHGDSNQGRGSGWMNRGHDRDRLEKNVYMPTRRANCIMLCQWILSDCAAICFGPVSGLTSAKNGKKKNVFQIAKYLELNI